MRRTGLKERLSFSICGEARSTLLLLANEKQVCKYLEEQNTSFSKTSDLINKYKASLSKETGKLETQIGQRT